jgi:hypothetical protein
MKLNHRHVGKLVKVINFGDEDTFLMDYVGRPWAIPVTVLDWFDHIDQEYSSYQEGALYFIPPDTLGMVVEIAHPVPKVTINYARVLFPKTLFKDPDNEYFKFPQTTGCPAGAYWISGDFLEGVETE